MELDKVKKEVDFFKYISTNNVTVEELASYLNNYIKSEKKLEYKFQDKIDRLLFNTRMLTGALKKHFYDNKDYSEFIKHYIDFVEESAKEVEEELYK